MNIIEKQTTAIDAFRTLTIGYNSGDREFEFRFKDRQQKQDFLAMLDRNDRHYNNEITGNAVQTEVL